MKLEKAIVAVMENRDKIKASDLCLLVREAVGDESLSAIAIGKAAKIAGFCAKQGAKGVRLWEKVQPEKVQPEKVQPEKVQPEKVQPEKVRPEKVQPEKVQPEKVQPAVAQPITIPRIQALKPPTNKPPTIEEVMKGLQKSEEKRVLNFPLGDEKKIKEKSSCTEWSRKVAQNKDLEGKSWSEAYYPEEWKRTIPITVEEQRKRAYVYLREFGVVLPPEEFKIIKSLTAPETDYYLTGYKESIDKFVALILLQNYPKNWSLRSTYDTVAFYLSNEEDTPNFCDVVTPILIVENGEFLPENKLTEQVNLHLLAERQAKKKTTIFLGTVPFPCVKQLCKTIHCGKKITEKSIKTGDVL
jgi:hypothetical protein